MSKNQLLKSLQAAATKDYTSVTPGFAYVYTHNGQNGIRLEAPDLVLEFSNGVPIGRGLFSKPSISNYTQLTYLIDRSQRTSLLLRGIGLETRQRHAIQVLDRKAL